MYKQILLIYTDLAESFTYLTMVNVSLNHVATLNVLNVVIHGN